jgi:Flp pilus assembly protein TadD
MGRRGSFTVISCLALLAITLAVYSPLLRHPFVNFDDEAYVVENAHVHAGLTWQTFKWALTATEASNWHPLTWLSHALDYQLYGLNAGGHHFTNLLIHLLNVGLLFWLLVKATRRPGTSLVVAALFALHPINVESVAWVAERKNVLSTLFFLLAMGAYGWYAAKPDMRRYLALVAFFALGLAAKPMVITLPFVLLLLDYWPLNRIEGWGQPNPIAAKPGTRRQGSETNPVDEFSVPQKPWLNLIIEKLPLLALCMGSAVLTIVAQRTKAIRSLERFSLWSRLENSAISYAMYIVKAFWPSRLALYYPYPRHALTTWKPAVAALFLTVVTAWVWKCGSSRRYLVTGWLWYLGTLVPVIGIVQVGDQAMADRYAYIPLIGIFVMAVWTAAEWMEAAQVGKTWQAGTVAILAGALCFMTWRQLGYWKSNVDLWGHALQITGPTAVAEANFAGALRENNRAEEALPHYEIAAQMQPGDPKRRIDLAVDLAQCGRLEDAIAQYEIGIQLASDPETQARSYDSIAMLYGMLAEYDKARESYHQALTVDPEMRQELISHLSGIVRTNPSAAGNLMLGMLLQEAGRASEARSAYEKALDMDSSLEDAQRFLNELSQVGQ